MRAWAAARVGKVPAVDSRVTTVPAKALGFGEQEIRILKMKLDTPVYQDLLANEGFETALRAIFRDSGREIRNEARFNYALALAGAGFSLYSVWQISEWILTCDDGRNLPLGVLPNHPCGKAKDLPVEEIRALLLERWKKDQEAMGEIIAPEDIDYRAQTQNYLLTSEDELRKLWTKISAQEKSESH